MAILNLLHFLQANEEGILSIPDLAARIAELEGSVYGPGWSDEEDEPVAEVNRPDVSFELVEAEDLGGGSEETFDFNDLYEAHYGSEGNQPVEPEVFVQAELDELFSDREPLDTSRG